MNEGENKTKREVKRGGQRQTDQADQTDRTDPNENAARQARLRPSGGYRKLRSFQVTTIIYDATVSFCDRFMDRARARWTRWSRRRAAGGRTLPRAAGPRPLPARPNCAWSMSPAPASTNCCWTSRTSCGNTVWRNGQKTITGR